MGELVAEGGDDGIILIQSRFGQHCREEDVMGIERAVISVSDKTGLAEFGKALAEMGVEILSTGGTSKLLKKNGVAVKDVNMVIELEALSFALSQEDEEG